MEEFFEDFPPRRWMETFEPLGRKWPMGVDYERSFRQDVIDHDKELVVRGELPGVEKDDIQVTVMGDRPTMAIQLTQISSVALCFASACSRCDCDESR